ncbi:ABC transporter permease [Streptomyces jeddahensis]|uniref:D-allose transport system permease protein AlsC n=1 Tax=Streptomyces jeddahensis TaxID=1716141 RepID=A0A177HT33_9ACTN|nr:ABC transporter permease [Streptomyces jeddahensis]OAH14035.1 D-allose transport system permease protein AlsC [Streptomyces jeddahensis]
MRPPATAPAPDSEPAVSRWEPLRYALRTPTAGPLAALILAVVVFSLGTETFLTPANLSLVLQQSIVIGTLALGQSLIILTAGIDLANGAIAVLGTVVMARFVFEGGDPATAVLLGLVATTAIGLVSGLLVTRLGLPPFIVTLGILTVVYAVGRLYSQSRSYPVTDDLLRFWGNGVRVGGALITWGTFVLLVLYAFFWYLLAKTAWGRHVYAVGNAPQSARLTGINVERTVLSVYVTAGLLYGFAAWQALGRIPNADPNAYQTANLESITAVVIGGTSLFGGRGGVVGTLIGTLIVSVLRSGLTQAGIDSLYQDVATGTLVIVAVGIDKVLRRGRSR